MRASRLGQILFGAGFAGLGVLSLLFDDFAMVWQPVPAWVPLRAPLAYASGLVLLAGGLGMLLRRTARLATLILAANLLLWLLLLQVPRVLGQPASETSWLGFAETLSLLVGAWTLFALLAAPDRGPWPPLVAGEPGIRLARFLYGMALPLIGLSHFTSVRATASLVPAWLPFHVGFAYLIGAGHIAAGLGILLAVLPRQAATAEALMISTFTLLVWLPGVVAEPSSRLQWTALCVSTAITGAAWAVAGPLQDQPWGQIGWRPRRAAHAAGFA